MSNEQLLITGDFNIHVDITDDSDALKLFDLLESLGLRQHVHGHTLDLIITRYSDQVVQDSPQTDRLFRTIHRFFASYFMCNHAAVTANVVTYRKPQSVHMDSLKNDLAASELCQKQPEDLSNLAPLLCKYSYFKKCSRGKRRMSIVERRLHD